MPIDPIKIPQNVYIEDRIVGPLTLRQVLIVTLGGGFSYAMWASLSKAYGVVALPIQIMVWIPAVIAAAFAFIRVNDVSMTRLLLLFLERLNKPALRTWSPRRGLIINIRTFTTPKKDTANHAEKKNFTRIDELSALLDRNVDGIAQPNQPERIATSVMATATDRTAPITQEAPASPPKAGSVSLFHDISPAR